MKSLGVILIVISLILGFYAFNMDVSVSTIYGNRVVNFGLINRQQNFLYLSGLMLVIGLVLFLIKNYTKKDIDTNLNAKAEYNEVKTEKGFNYKLPINDKVTFEILKEKTLNFYSNIGFIKQVDNENTFFIKNDSINAYVEIKNRDSYLNMSIYNTEKPNFIDSLYDENSEKDISRKDIEKDNIEKLLKLSKLLDKGLISEDDFKAYKKTLS